MVSAMGYFGVKIKKYRIFFSCRQNTILDGRVSKILNALNLFINLIIISASFSALWFDLII